MKISILSRLVSLCLLSSFAAPEGGGKRVAVAKKSFDENDDGTLTGVCRFAFGEEGKGGELECNVFDLPSEMQRRLTVHGFLQKAGDSYAGVKGDVGQAKTNVQAIIDQLKAGAWQGDREDAGPRLGELAEAIARIKSVDLEKARAAVEKASDDDRKAWRANAKVKAVIAQLRAEKAAKELETAGEGQLNVDLG